MVRIVEQLADVGHKVVIDDRFLSAGDPIIPEIRQKIHDVDFVCVFLSMHSVQSTWVARETVETLYVELETRQTKLVPCLVEACNLPESLSRLGIADRLYIDFVHDERGATKRLMERLEDGSQPIFEDERHLVLQIPTLGLDIYLTGELCRWEKNDQLKYSEMLDSYLLFGFDAEPGTYFKHFALCAEGDADRIRGQLTNAGFSVTGVGSTEPGTGKRMIWFCLPGYKVHGQDQNNRWSG